MIRRIASPVAALALLQKRALPPRSRKTESTGTSPRDFPYAIDFEDGERGRNRTYNLLIKSQLLCQLSYAPTANGRSETVF